MKNSYKIKTLQTEEYGKMIKQKNILLNTKNKLILFFIIHFPLSLNATTTGIDQSILNQNKQEHRQLIQDIKIKKHLPKQIIIKI